MESFHLDYDYYLIWQILMEAWVVRVISKAEMHDSCFYWEHH